MPPIDDDEMTSGHPSSRNAPQSESAPDRPTGPLSATFPAEIPPGDSVVYGPDIADEHTLRLLGTVEGKRILEFGVGSGRNAVALARRGARVIAIDPSLDRVEHARSLAEEAEVRIEVHQGDLADVAFVRADAIDLVLSVYALAGVDDIDRAFRQAHRVLRSECPLVVSLPHPAWHLVDPTGPDQNRLARSWFAREPEPWSVGRDHGVEYARSIAELFGGLYRASFRVDAVLEPEPEPDARFRSRWWTDVMRRIPATIILRARKLGV